MRAIEVIPCSIRRIGLIAYQARPAVNTAKGAPRATSDGGPCVPVRAGRRLVLRADEMTTPKVYRDPRICCMTSVTRFGVMVTPQPSITLPTSVSVCEWRNAKGGL